MSTRKKGGKADPRRSSFYDASTSASSSSTSPKDKQRTTRKRALEDNAATEITSASFAFKRLRSGSKAGSDSKSPQKAETKSKSTPRKTSSKSGKSTPPKSSRKQTAKEAQRSSSRQSPRLSGKDAETTDSASPDALPDASPKRGIQKQAKAESKQTGKEGGKESTEETKQKDKGSPQKRKGKSKLPEFPALSFAPSADVLEEANPVLRAQRALDELLSAEEQAINHTFPKDSPHGFVSRTFERTAATVRKAVKDKLVVEAVKAMRPPASNKTGTHPENEKRRMRIANWKKTIENSRAEIAEWLAEEKKWQARSQQLQDLKTPRDWSSLLTPVAPELASELLPQSQAPLDTVLAQARAVISTQGDVVLAALRSMIEQRDKDRQAREQLAAEISADFRSENASSDPKDVIRGLLRAASNEAATHFEF